MVQLFAAASLKVVALLWSPLFLNVASKKIVTTSLLIDCFYIALILRIQHSPSYMTSLAPPRLQWQSIKTHKTNPRYLGENDLTSG